MLSKRSLLLSCAIAATATAGLAQAAEATKPANEIEELVVTAEKREQSLQDVPVAISAFTDERRELLGINNAQDLTNFTPGIAYNTGNDRLTMRGIGRLTNNRASEGGVAMYSDGFYTSSVYSFSKSSLFLDRTEVLRGPQGTLYGRNAIGGAMNVISKKPTDHFYGEGRVGYGNYDNETYEAAVSGPLMAGIRGRLAGSWNNQHKGYYKNISGGPSEGARGRVWYWEAQLDGNITDRFDWWVKTENSKTDSLGRGAGGRQGVTLGVAPIATTLVPGTTPSAAFANYGRTSPLASTICSRCFDADTPNVIKIESQTFSGQASLHLDGFDVRYIGGRTWYHYELTTDVDGTSRGAPFTVLPGQPGAPGGAAGAANQIIPTGGTQFFPKLANQYDEEPWWFSNEVDIASTHDGPVQWLLGLYQFREESNYTPTDARSVDDARFDTPLLPNGTPAALNPTRSYAIGTSKTRSESYAAFGQIDWQATEQFKFTVGLRYTHDEKNVLEGARLICFMAASPVCPAAVERATGRPIDFTGLAVATGTQVDPSVVPGSIFTDPATGIKYRSLHSTWQGMGGTLGVDWKPDPDTLVYAKYSRGYKAGGFNSATTTLTALVTTKKETVDAYEIGAKKTFNGNLQANVSAFWYDYQNLQAVLTAFDTLLNANTSLYANLPKARIGGLEVETIWQPIDNLQINANYAYLNTKIREACCYQDPDDPLALARGAQPAKVSGTTVLQDLKGQKLGASTPHRVTVNANYTWNFDPGSLSASASYIWRSATYYSIFNRAYNKAKAFDQVDARLIWNAANKNYTVIGFVKNVMDTKGQIVMAGSRITNPGPNFGLVNQTASYINPRTYGVELQYRF